jgi:ribosome-associated protein
MNGNDASGASRSMGAAQMRRPATTRDEAHRHKEYSRQMTTVPEGSPQAASQRDVPADNASSQVLLDIILHCLDEAKAEEIVSIDLAGKSTIADHMVVASGRSDRHVSAIGEQLQRKLKDEGFGKVRSEGMEQGDWVLIDAGSIIVHVFRPEVREFYKLERMWSGERPAEGQTH